MVKIILFLIFIALFVYLASTPIWLSALWGISGIFTGFYDNVLVYGNTQIYVIFALFVFAIGYWIVKH